VAKEAREGGQRCEEAGPKGDERDSASAKRVAADGVEEQGALRDRDDVGSGRMKLPVLRRGNSGRRVLVPAAARQAGVAAAGRVVRGTVEGDPT